MTVRGVRGATTVATNEAERVLSATQTLLEEMIAANGISAEDLGAAFFTVTCDLNAAFPAAAARRLGWQHVPMLDALEIPVPDSLPRCIRVLLLWNTTTAQSDVVHVYQNEARQLRPDLAGRQPAKQEDQS